MDPHQYRLLRVYLSLDERKVLVGVDLIGICYCLEFAAVARGNDSLSGPCYEPVLLEPVLDDVGDCDNEEAVFPGEGLEVLHPRHAAVLVHYLADDARGLQPREPREVYRALCLASAHQHPASARPQGEYVAGAHQIAGDRIFVDAGKYGLCPVCRGDARGNAVLGGY